MGLITSNSVPILFAEDEEELKEIIAQLQKTADKVGLEINMSKTK